MPGTTRDSELLLPSFVHCLASFLRTSKCVIKEMREVAVVAWLLALAAPSTGRLVPGCREVELQLAQECRQEQARPRVA